MQRRSFLTGGLALATLSPVRATASDAADGKRKVNLAGRQRMLTQRMAKAACFMALGVESAFHRGMLGAAHDLFDRTLGGLRYGDNEQGMLRETDARMLAALVPVDKLWEVYGAAIRDLRDAPAVSETAIALVAELNLPILSKMNEAVGIAERIHGSTTVPLHLAIALNIAGRQRMLTQKMAKEYALVSLGIDPTGNRANLAETMQLFDASLEALIAGAPMFGIRPPVQPALAARLGTVREMWGPFRDTLAVVATGGSAEPAQVFAVAQASNPLLVEMNEAVFLYEAE